MSRLITPIPYLLLIVGGLWLSKCLLDRNHRSLFGNLILETFVSVAVFIIALLII